MNKFIGIGRLTNDIELKETSNGKYYVKKEPTHHFITNAFNSLKKGFHLW